MKKKYGYGSTRLSLEQLRAVDPMAASNIEAEIPPPKQSKSDKLFSELLILFYGAWLGGLLVYGYMKLFK